MKYQNKTFGNERVTYNKRNSKLFMEKEIEIENNLGASINFTKDFTDNHKYNYIRMRLWKQKNVQNVEE